MATEVRIPTTGNAGEDAVVVEWLAAVGDEVAAGATLLTIETAKSTVDVEAPAAGTLLARHAEAGDEVAEFSVVALIGAAGEQVAAPAGATAVAEAEPAMPGATAASTASAPSAAAPSSTPASSAAPASGAPAADPAGPPTDVARRISASPRARRVAAERGAELSSIRGSGPLGRILAADVEAAASASPVASAPAASAPAASASAASASAAPATASAPATSPAAQPAASALEPVRIRPVRGARKVTAQRMQASLADAAQVTLTRYADAGRMLEWVERLRAAAEGDESKPRVGVNDALLYATARVAARHPEANSWFSWEGISEFDAVQLGFAVDTEHGLLVPVIRDAHRLPIGRLAEAARAAIERARSGRLQPDEMEGGTFTVSNLGGLGVHWFTPVLNPPQTCILGVGATHRAGPDAPAMLPLSLTFDHRAIDGVAAAAVLRDLATAIESIDTLDAF